MRPTNHVLFALLVVTAAPLAAQNGVAGSATIQLSIHLPDSTKVPGVPIPISGDLTTQMTFMTDGMRLAMEVLPNMSGTGPGAGMRVKLVFSPAGDTIHIGMILPPELAKAAGGAPGMRIDMPVSMLGAANPLFGRLMDSVARTMTDSLGKAMPTYRALGTTAVVAGIRCQEWEMVVRADTTRSCVIPTPPALLVLQEKFKDMTGMATLMAQIPGIASLQKEAYGGKQVVPLRTVNSKTGMRMELTAFTAGAPDPAVFELPSDLQVIPMPGKPGGGQR